MNVNWRNVRLIFLREIRDQLRDRRTVFMVLVLPVVLYPVLGLFMAELRLWFREQPCTVVLLGSEHLPGSPALIDEEQFGSRWFHDPADIERVRLVTDQSATTPDLKSQPEKGAGPAAPPNGVEPTAAPRPLPVEKTAPEKTALRPASSEQAVASRTQAEVPAAVAEGSRSKIARESEADVPQRRGMLTRTQKRQLLDDAHAIVALREQQREADEALKKYRAEWELLNQDPSKGTELAAAQARVLEAERSRQELHERIGQLFAGSKMQILILIPPQLKENLARVRTELGDRESDHSHLAEYPRPELLFNRADDKSQLAYSRVRDLFSNWESVILQQQLETAHLPRDLPHPIQPVVVNLALDEQISASLWGVLFPALLMLMSVTGAFHPAIDLVAGEKERGTMETLLICPATRTEIVLGKFFTVMSFSSTTALLNLLSMGITGRHIMSMSLREAGAGAFTLPSIWTLFWVVVLLIPLSVLFSALSLALATYARSSKEGQYYLTPLLMVTLGLTVFCMSPGVELQPTYSVIPVANIALLLKGMLMSPANASHLAWYLVPVLLTSVAYSAVALAWAIDQFRREDVLFRETEQFDVRLWLTHLVRDRAPLPSFSEAAFCFVLIMLLQFGMMHLFQAASGSQPGAALKMMMIQQVALIAAPALIMGAILTSSLRASFRLRWPPTNVLLIGIVLPVVLHPLVFELRGLLERTFFDPLPKHVEDAISALVTGTQPVWLVLLAIAIVPAICEEIAFRGFVLGGFSHRRRYWLGILLSSFTFGLVHMIPQQVFNATLLGIVLGLLAVRSGSLLPSLVFHMLHNGLMVLYALYAADFVRQLPANPFIRMSGETPHYGWPILVPAAVMVVILLRWLVRSPNANSLTTASSPVVASSRSPVAIES